MNQNHSHPSESNPDRAYIHLEEISDFVKHTIHSTFTEVILESIAQAVISSKPELQKIIIKVMY